MNGLARDVIGSVANTEKVVYVFVHVYCGCQTTEPLGVELGPTVSSSESEAGANVLKTEMLVAVKAERVRQHEQ